MQLPKHQATNHFLLWAQAISTAKAKAALGTTSKSLEWQINATLDLVLGCQERGESPKTRGANDLQPGVNSLANSETRIEQAKREGTTQQLKSQLRDYVWQAKKRGLAEQTIRQRIYKLSLLAKKGADLNNPDSVLSVLANST